MAKKKADAPPKRQGRTGRATQVYLNEELWGSLDAYIEATRPRPTITSVLEMALEDLLRKVGHYPAPKKE